MLRRAWPIVVASCALLAACLDDQQALQSSEPIYTMVFFASDSTTLSKRAQRSARESSDRQPPIGARFKPNAEGQGLRRWPFRQGRNREP